MAEVTDREFTYLDRLGNSRRIQVGVRPIIRFAAAEDSDLQLRTHRLTIRVDGREIPWSPVFERAHADGWLDQAIMDFIDREATRLAA